MAILRLIGHDGGVVEMELPVPQPVVRLWPPPAPMSLYLRSSAEGLGRSVVSTAREFKFLGKGDSGVFYYEEITDVSK